MRTNMSKTIVLLLGAMLFTACNSENPVSAANKDVKVMSETPADRPTFADAMDNNKPLAKVEGDYRPLPYLDRNLDGRFADALEYAEETESYSLLIWQNGDLLVEHYFDGYDKNLRADSASMHKSVAGLLVGIAIEDGFIKSVDEPVGTYIPQWAEDERGKIPLRNVLEMSTGLEALSSEGGMDSPAVKFMMQGDSAREIMLSQPLKAKPGDVFHYQNSSTQLLGLILENATGKTYDDYLSSRLWKPLGAQDAFVWLNEPMGFPKTFTSYLATPQDWLRLGLLVKDVGAFDGRQIVPRSFVQSMTSPSSANPNYGWQIWLGNRYAETRYYNDAKSGFGVTASEPYIVDDIIYFDGFGGQRVYISRSQDLVVVRTGNVSMTWDDAKLPNEIIRVLNQN